MYVLHDAKMPNAILTIDHALGESASRLQQKPQLFIDVEVWVGVAVARAALGIVVSCDEFQAKHDHPGDPEKDNVKTCY